MTKKTFATIIICGAVIGFQACDDPELKNEIKELREQIQSKETLSEADLAKAQELIKQAQTELETLKKQTANQETPTPEKSETPQTPENSVSKADLENLFSDLENRLNEISSSLENFKKDDSDKTSEKDYSENFKNLTNQIQGTNTTVESLIQKIETLSGQQTNINSSVNELNQKIKQISENQTNNKNSIDGLNEKIETISEINSYFDELKATLAKISDALIEDDSKPTSGTHEGHDWVDLGTGVLWATHNIGTDKEDHVGDSYQWGEIEGKTMYGESTSSAKTVFNGTNGYKFWNGNNSKYTKYFMIDIEMNETYSSNYTNYTFDYTELQPEDDVATQKWGGKWRMPTQKEFEDLLSKCHYESEFYNGGIRFYKKKKVKYASDIYNKRDDANIFLPLGGNNSINYWSSTLQIHYSPFCAYTLYIYKNSNYNNLEVEISWDHRSQELWRVRPVCKLD